MTIRVIKQQQPSFMIRFVNKSSGLRCARYLDIITQNLYLCDVKISDPRVMRAKSVIWSPWPVTSVTSPGTHDTGHKGTGEHVTQHNISLVIIRPQQIKRIIFVWKTRRKASQVTKWCAISLISSVAFPSNTEKGSPLCKSDVWLWLEDNWEQLSHFVNKDSNY